jgi:hypothetical protein
MNSKGAVTKETILDNFSETQIETDVGTSQFEKSERSICLLDLSDGKYSCVKKNARYQMHVTNTPFSQSRREVLKST